MAVTTVKPIFLNGSGVYQPVSNDVSNGNLVPLTAVTISETQSYPDTTNTTHAATIGYVNAAASAAVNGLDYKNAANVYIFVTTSSGITTIAGVQGLMNTTTGVFTTGTRALVDFETPDIEAGLYNIAGTDGAWTLTRTADMATGSSAQGDYVFCYEEFNGSTLSALNTAYVCQQQKPNDVVGTNTLTFSAYGSPNVYTAGNGIDIASNVISAKVDGVTTDFDGSQNITVLGVPDQFTINTVATNNTVTASNLNTLTASGFGPTTLHLHANNSAGFTNSGAALTVGKVATYNGATTSLAAKSAGRVLGIVVNDAGTGTTYIANAGYAVLAAAPTGTGSAGDNIYVSTAGAVCFYDGLSSGDYVTKVGMYLGAAGPAGAEYVAIAVQEFGIKP